ncbi:hypothetical protein M0813_21257 [Anaeramoeba flamelloides]|uniref:Transposase n=1 Tax=Anaeramoeba flamelloides TaxID=1746091 RepID=A0ABQ8YHB7_9EUKA|nr:hypothetical protein M0813_21257 [Anaeramoeba flamelloides]
MSNFKKGKTEIYLTKEIGQKFRDLKKSLKMRDNSSLLDMLIEDFYKHNQTELEIFLEKKRKESFDTERKNQQEKIFLECDETTRFYLIPIKLIPYLQNCTWSFKKKNNIYFKTKTKKERKKIYVSSFMQQNNISKLDVLLASRVFLSGMGYTEYKDIFSQLFHFDFLISSSSFFRIQKTFIIPSIKRVFFAEQEKILEQLRQKEELCVLTDGRFSRPQRKKGPAHYCTDVVIEEETEFVVAIDTMSQQEVQGSCGNIETQLFLRMMGSYPLNSLDITDVVSDENLSMLKRVPEKYPDIRLSTCIGHKATSLGKKWKCMCNEKSPIDSQNITDKRKKYNYRYKSLLFLSEKIKKHFKISCYLAKDAEDFYRRWENFIEHMCGNHSVCCELNPNSKCCQIGQEHPPKINEEEKKLCYELFKKLKKKVLKNIENFITAKQTSIVECFNSTLNRFCPKRKFYQLDNFKVRTYITALVWNFKKKFPFSTSLSIYNQITNIILSSSNKYNWEKSQRCLSDGFEERENDYLLFANFLKKVKK